MGKKDRGQASGTAYKIYSTPGHPLTDNSIGKEIGEFFNLIEKIVPMPLIPYKCNDVVEMLPRHRSVVTIRKAARDIGLGYMKGTRRILNADEVRKLVQHFLALDAKRAHESTSDVPVTRRTWWAFQEIAQIKDALVKLIRDFKRFHFLLHDIMNKNAEWRDEMLQANRALQRRIDEIGGQYEKVDSDGDDSIGLRSPPENSPHGQTRRDSRVLPRHGSAAIPDNPGDG